MPALLAPARSLVRDPTARPLVPLPAPREAAPPPRSRPAPGALRRSLGASTLEGMAAELVGACTGGATITAWALHLGCSTVIVGLLGALPFVAHLLQLPAARLTARFGPRRVALVSIAIARQAFLPLALLPFLPVAPRRAEVMLVCAAAALNGLGIICNNGWVAWMGEIVPARIRGRYFGRRTAITTTAAALSGLAAGILLDHARSGGSTRAVLAALAATACLAGVASTFLMARQHGGRPQPPARRVETPFSAVLRARAPRRLAAFQALTNAASGLAEPYLALFMLRDAGLGFGFVALQAAVCAGARVIAAPAWGRLVDRPGGSRRVLVLSTAVLAANPLLWLAAARGGTGVWMLAALVGGTGAAGTSVAGFALPLAIAPPSERPTYCAVFALAGGVAYGAGAALSGHLASGPPPAGAGPLASPLVVPFACCSALRLASAAAALAITRRRAVQR